MHLKLKLLVLAFAAIGLMCCKTSRLNQSSTLQAGFFKVAILYPSGEDKTFDFTYYEKTHMPMVAALLGSNLRFYEIDKGIAGRLPTDKVPFVAAGYFYVGNVAEYNQVIAQNREKIVGDFKNYTNIQPQVLISEVKQVVHTAAR